jgi:hypothetical protein
MRSIKNATFGVALLLALAVSAAAQTDVPGWQEARWGMTEKDLLEAFKTSIKKFDKREIYGNERYADYGIPDYEVNGRKYVVSFQMDNENNKLSQVLVKYISMKAASSEEAIFDGLDALLTRKYGEAKYKKDDRKSDPMSLERQWAFPTTTISLSYSFMRSLDFSMVAITYFPTRNKDMDKL